MKIKSMIVALAVSASALTACGGSSKWCEFDSTDQVVADSFCQAGTPGYEWETGSDSTKKKHQRKTSYKVKNQSKAPVYRAPARKPAGSTYRAPARSGTSTTKRR
jgi:hypothetical protein